MATTGKNQYADTPIQDFYLDLAQLPTAAEVANGKTIETIVVGPKYQHRPDLLSFSLYGNSSYWWVIALLNRNQLQDPIRDLKTGMVLNVLNKADIAGVV
jgi:nucleoid-associated protein YgaU